MNNRDKALKLIDNLEKSNKKTISKQRKADIEYGYLMACQEPIDDEELDELSDNYYFNEEMESSGEFERIKNAYEAGYRCAFNNKVKEKL